MEEDEEEQGNDRLRLLSPSSMILRRLFRSMDLQLLRLLAIRSIDRAEEHPKRVLYGFSEEEEEEYEMILQFV